MDRTWTLEWELERVERGNRKKGKEGSPVYSTTARSVVLGLFEGLHTLMPFMRRQGGHSSGSRSPYRCAPSLQRAVVSSLLPFDGTRTAQPRWPWYWLQSRYRMHRSTSSHQRGAMTMTLGLEATPGRHGDWKWGDGDADSGDACRPSTTFHLISSHPETLVPLVP